MRILIVTQNFPPIEGGISTHCYEMARNWASDEEVWVLAPHAPQAESPCGDGDMAPAANVAGRVVRMRPAGNQVSRFFVTLASTLSLARRVRPDVIYGTHWRNCGIALGILAWFRRTPFLLAVHGSEVFRLLPPGRAIWRALFQWVARRSRGFVALGQYQRQILESLGISAARIFTSPEGIDLARLAAIDPEAPSRIRARHRLNGKRVILTVGRLVERKGHDMVIRALARVLREVPEAVYVIVGRGPAEASLRVLAREMGLRDHVLFCGFIADREVLAYYQAADVFAMPNREVEGDTEGFGIVFVEAGACGKPVIGGRSGGAVEVIADGVTGFLVDPLGVEQIADTLTALLRNPELAARMGQEARARIERHYTYQQVAGNIAAFLRQAMQGTLLC